MAELRKYYAATREAAEGREFYDFSDDNAGWWPEDLPIGITDNHALASDIAMEQGATLLVLEKQWEMELLRKTLGNYVDDCKRHLAEIQAFRLALEMACINEGGAKAFQAFFDRYIAAARKQIETEKVDAWLDEAQPRKKGKNEDT